MARAKKSAAVEAAPEVAPVLHGIKGFDANLQCRGFQFEVGKTYVHEGKVVICRSGFHAITDHPLAVFGYYAPAGSRFCRVELSGQTASDDGVKTAASILTVGQEFGLSELVQGAVKWVMDRATPEGEQATGDHGAASATGDHGAASATGVRGAAMTSGCGGRVRGSDGNALFAVERETWDGPIVSVACGIVGRAGIKPDVWYAAVGGKLVEA